MAIREYQDVLQTQLQLQEDERWDMQNIETMDMMQLLESLF